DHDGADVWNPVGLEGLHDEGHGFEVVRDLRGGLARLEPQDKILRQVPSSRASPNEKASAGADALSGAYLSLLTAGLRFLNESRIAYLELKATKKERFRPLLFCSEIAGQPQLHDIACTKCKF